MAPGIMHGSLEVFPFTILSYPRALIFSFFIVLVCWPLWVNKPIILSSLAISAVPSGLMHEPCYELANFKIDRDTWDSLATPILIFWPLLFVHGPETIKQEHEFYWTADCVCGPYYYHCRLYWSAASVHQGHQNSTPSLSKCSLVHPGYMEFFGQSSQSKLRGMTAELFVMSTVILEDCVMSVDIRLLIAKSVSFKFH